MCALSRCHTEVILIPSSRDVHHQPVYPTPPYVLRKSYPHLHLLPDPALLDVNGIVFGITSTDVLKHITREEVVKYVIKGLFEVHLKSCFLINFNFLLLVLTVHLKLLIVLVVVFLTSLTNDQCTLFILPQKISMWTWRCGMITLTFQ